MIQKESTLKVIDNSGALLAKCIGINKKFNAHIGDIITVSLIKSLPNRKVKNGEVHKALIIRTKKEWRRLDGSLIQFDENSLILLENDLTPKGSRIFGPVPLELSSYSKLASLVTTFI